MYNNGLSDPDYANFGVFVIVMMVLAMTDQLIY